MIEEDSYAELDWPGAKARAMQHALGWLEEKKRVWASEVDDAKTLATLVVVGLEQRFGQDLNKIEDKTILLVAFETAGRYQMAKEAQKFLFDIDLGVHLPDPLSSYSIAQLKESVAALENAVSNMDTIMEEKVQALKNRQEINFKKILQDTASSPLIPEPYGPFLHEHLWWPNVPYTNQQPKSATME